MHPLLFKIKLMIYLLTFILDIFILLRLYLLKDYKTCGKILVLKLILDIK